MLIACCLALGALPSAVRADTTADSVYASPALRALVAALAADGREPPRPLAGYRARVVQVEQVESTVAWSAAGGAPGPVEQHVIGYRAQGVTAGGSALSLFRRPWIVPVLYGNRLQLLFGRDAGLAPADASADSTPARGGAALVAVHPFADDRDRVYRFTGGDTVATIRSAGRAIPIVRMRGQFLTVGREGSLLRRALGGGRGGRSPSPSWRTRSSTAATGSRRGSGSSGRRARRSPASSARRCAS